MRLAQAAASAAAVTGLALLAVAPAHADAEPAMVSLHTTLTGPQFEADDLGADQAMYLLKVTNDLPQANAAATGVEVKTTVFQCPKGDLIWLHCTVYQTQSQKLGPIAAGGDYRGMFELELPNNQTDVWFRLVSDVTHVDQINLGSPPDTCVYGLNAGGPCAADTTDLKP